MAPKNLELEKTVGLLVRAPKVLRGNEIDFLLIGEDGIEYQIQANRKSFQMWALLETRVEITGVIIDSEVNTRVVKILTFKCIDDFVTESVNRDLMDDTEFDIGRLDFAI